MFTEMSSQIYLKEKSNSYSAYFYSGIRSNLKFTAVTLRSYTRVELYKLCYWLLVYAVLHQFGLSPGGFSGSVQLNNLNFHLSGLRKKGHRWSWWFGLEILNLLDKLAYRSIIVSEM